MREALGKIRKNYSLTELSPMYRQLHYFSLRPGYYITSHQHPFYHVNLYLEGSMTFHANGKEHSVNAGDLVICPPGLEHSLYTEEGYTQIGIDLIPFQDHAGLFEQFEACFSKKFSVMAIQNHKRFALSEYFFKDLSDFNRLKAIHYIESILLTAISVIKEQTSGQFKDAFLDVMNQTNAYNLSVAEISKQLNISRTHLERLTHKEFACSVKTYCNKLKISLLCYYLECTDMSSKELCEIVGFYDASHLTTFFKRHMNCTPTEYRNNCR